MDGLGGQEQTPLTVAGGASGCQPEPSENVDDRPRWLEAAPCRLCGAGGQGALPLCAACEADLPWVDRACEGCALPLHGDVKRCGPCAVRPPPWDEAAVAVRYGYPAAWLVQRLKFEGDLAMAPLLAGLMARRPPPFLAAIPCLVPVPLHWRRRFLRGFDQAEQLARELGRRFGLETRRLLRRARRTRPQVGLSAAERRGNLRTAFRCVTDPPPGPVCLVDDVMTTGATFAAAARALRSAGAGEIVIWCFARAEGPR